MNLKFWQRNRETREGAYTDALTTILRQQADDTEALARTAVREGCAGLWARAFASAEVSNAPMGALTAGVLAMAGRGLHDRGQIVFEIVVDDGLVGLIPASDWYVQGARVWRYRLTIANPTSIVTRWRPAAAVVHLRYDPSPEAPWQAQGPASRSSTTEALTNALEMRLSQEANSPAGNVIPVPEGGNSDQLQADIKALKGGTILVPSAIGGWDLQSTANQAGSDWQPRRLGANPPEVLNLIRRGVADDVAVSAGVPPVLFRGDTDGTSMREGWRQFLHGTISPVSDMMAEELREKLDAPDLAFSFDKLFASDLSGRARAFQSMVGGGMDVAKAAALAGLMEAE